jgi:hypothetical protein
MRTAIALALFAGALAMAPGSASSFPLAPADQAAMSREVGGGAVEKVHHKTAHARHYPRYASVSPRRYNWTYYPYWRPYQYYNWQYYYPYGGRSSEWDSRRLTPRSSLKDASPCCDRRFVAAHRTGSYASFSRGRLA